jgi:hypothetical protein
MFLVLRRVKVSTKQRDPKYILNILVVIVFAIGPKVRGFRPREDDGFVREIKVRITTFFGGEVKPAVPCSKTVFLKLSAIADHFIVCRCTRGPPS